MPLLGLLLIAALWTGVHEAPDNAPTYLDEYGYIHARR